MTSSKGFPTPVLDRALEREHNERERLRREALDRLYSALDTLSETVFFERAWIFGSVISPGRFTRYSDIDVAFDRLDDSDFFPAMSLLSNYLVREVDVIQLENYPLADSIRRKGLVWTPRR